MNTKTLEEWLNENRFPLHKNNLDPLAVVSAKPVKPKPDVKEAFDPARCPHGLLWLKCKDSKCFEELCRVEDAAYCPHGTLAGCPKCSAKEAFDPVDNSDLIEEIRKANYHYYSV
jgi:hypothetical protein